MGREATCAVSGVLKSPTIIVLLLISPFILVSILKKKVSSTIPFVSGQKPDTEETSKQKKL